MPPTNAHVTVGPDRNLHPGSVVTVTFTDDFAIDIPIRHPDHTSDPDLRDLPTAVNQALARIGWQIAHLPDRPVVDEDGRLWFTAREEENTD